MHTLTAYPHMLHGCDYNPEQWLHLPEILEQDIVQMKQAHINCVSVGIFAWAALEPEEGRYELDWLAQIIDRLYENGIYTVLATPSGAKPAWMAKKYPEICRVRADRTRELQCGRHNHCYTSPVYREKVYRMNTRLAERFGRHPAVILWHVSNEIQGECHCPLCQAAFRVWLKEQYGSLDALNHAWWTAFWSHTYTDWEQIESPSPIGEMSIQGLTLDWKRFCTHQTYKFFENEIAPLKRVNPAVPVTMNMMGLYDGINYQKMLPLLDVVSWDSYPSWHTSQDGDDTYNAFWADAFSDMCRSMLGKPFLLMENTPSQASWGAVCRPKTWGFHRLTAISNLAHGSDSIQYFQWRQSRGGAEKFHGAVMTHANRTDTRVFREVKGVGELLETLDDLCGARTRSQIAILWDVESHWAATESKGPRNAGIGDKELMLRMYLQFWKAGYSVDILDPAQDFSGYHMVCIPMLYMMRQETGQRIRDYVKQGGTAVMTMHSAVVDAHDLCYMGDTPACGLSEVFGVRFLEMDPLYDGEYEALRIRRAPFPLAETYRLERLCERITSEGAEVLGVYEHGNPCMPDDMPCLTKNSFGRGTAYYIAGYAEDSFYSDFLISLAEQLGVHPVLDTTFPHGVAAQSRMARSGTEYFFVMNWTREQKSVNLPFPLRDHETGRVYQNRLPLAPYGTKILTKAKPE